MNEVLTPAGYEATKEKLADLERRLARLTERTDLNPSHRADVRWSYKQMISQYRREIKLYEATHRKTATKS